MKYLIVLFLLINTAYSADCGIKTVEEVNACVVNDKIGIFVDYETCSWPEDTEEATYANLNCDPSVPLSFFEAALQDWKDLRLAELAEKARLKDVKDRLKAIGVKFGKHNSVDGLRPFMEKCGHSHSNPAIWVKEVFKVENISMLVCLESKKTEVDTDVSDKEAKKDTKDAVNVTLDNYDCSKEKKDSYAELLCLSRK